STLCADDGRAVAARVPRHGDSRPARTGPAFPTRVTRLGRLLSPVHELTTVDHWDQVWSGDVRLRLPLPLVITTRNLQTILRQHVRPGDRFLEIGCAPGKMLAWVAAVLKASVSGLDYSERGLATSRRLFKALNLAADFRCEDLRQTTFPSASFDVVVRFGVIEPF